MKDLTLDLYKYFSKFVPAEVLQKSFVQSENSRLPGYAEITAEVLNYSASRKPEIDTFVVSINEKFVSDKMKNSKEFILFVEYGKISYTPDVDKGVAEHIAITVAHNISDKNTDNLNELLIMNRCFDILKDIIDTMHAEQSELEFCSGQQLVTYPVEFSVVEPEMFYGCGGWAAIFKTAKTELV